MNQSTRMVAAAALNAIFRSVIAVAAVAGVLAFWLPFFRGVAFAAVLVLVSVLTAAVEWFMIKQVRRGRTPASKDVRAYTSRVPFRRLGPAIAVVVLIVLDLFSYAWQRRELGLPALAWGGYAIAMWASLNGIVRVNAFLRPGRLAQLGDADAASLIPGAQFEDEVPR